MELARRRNAFAMCFYEPLYTRLRVVGIELWWEKIRLTALATFSIDARITVVLSWAGV